FIQVPATGTSMTNLSPSIQVAVQDASGNTVSSASDSITLSIATGPGGAAITGGGSTATSSGVASFASVKLDKAGSYTLTATSGGTYGTATSSSITISAGTATQLAFIQVPATGTSMTNLSPSVQVAVQDSAGNTVSSASDSITLTIASGPSGAAITGG